MWQGKLVREATRQGNDNDNDKVARQMKAAPRTSLAKREVGIREKHKAPALTQFAEKQESPRTVAGDERLLSA